MSGAFSPVNYRGVGNGVMEKAQVEATNVGLMFEVDATKSVSRKDAKGAKTQRYET